MSRIHYNSEVWPSLFQMGLIIMLVVFNHIQPDQFFFLCGLMLIKDIYVFFLYSKPVALDVVLMYDVYLYFWSCGIQQDLCHWGMFLYFRTATGNTVKV